MARELHTSYANVQLSLTVFLRALGEGQLLCGPLSDMLGGAVAAGGIAVYIIGRVWASQADQLNTLLLGVPCRAWAGADPGRGYEHGARRGRWGKRRSCLPC